MSIFNKIVEDFVNNPEKMRMGAGKLSNRYRCLPETIGRARQAAREILNDGVEEGREEESMTMEEYQVQPPKKHKLPFNETRPVNVFKNKKIRARPGIHIISGCWHAPFQNKKMQQGVIKLINDLGTKVSGFHLIGDIVDMNSLSRYEMNSKPLPGVTLGYEYSEANNFLDSFQRVLPRDAQKTYIWGNHEDRYIRHINDINASKYADALVSPTNALHLKQRGYTVFENWKEDYLCLGNTLQLIHGEYCSANPARTHVNKMKSSVMFAHTHRIDINYDGEKAGFNIGWGGDVESKAFSYVSRISKMNWINGFALVHIDKEGDYFAQVIPVFKDSFWYNGKKYSG